VKRKNSVCLPGVLCDGFDPDLSGEFQNFSATSDSFSFYLFYSLDFFGTFCIKGEST